MKNRIDGILIIKERKKDESNMKKLTYFLKPYTKLLIIGPMFKLFEAILELMLPFLMSQIIDVGVANSDKNYIIKMGLFMLLTAVVGIICALICQYSASLVSQGVGTKIRNAIFEKIGTFSNVELDKFGTASLVNRITNDVNQVQLAVAMLIRLVIRAPFLCIGGLMMTFVIDVKLSIIIMIVLPIFILILGFIMKKTVPLYKNVQKKLDNIALVLRENLSGVRVIRAFAKEDYEKERFASHNNEYAENAVKVGKISALLNPLTNLIMNFAIGAIIWFGGVRVYEGSMSTGEIIAFVGYVTQILAALIVISNLVVIFTKAFASAARVSEVLETQPTIIDPVENTEKEPDKTYAVEFRNVSMKYNEDSKSAVENISFQIKKGETIGMIGGTGSGKSTIINLIPRFYDVEEGEIFVDGINVKDYNMESLREKIGMVPQKTVLFTGTIAQNIKWGKEDASDEEVRQAADTAQASEFIKKLPEGYETNILRGGVNVSGGQRQRLTIARALVRKPDILILDDSFNALDFATDAALRKALKSYTKDMTTFIISQRASTITAADQIIVLNDGEIAGIGKHKELFEQCQVYREICESQVQERTCAGA